METIHKNRLLFWLLIFLIIVNLAALATYFLLPKEKPARYCGTDPSSPGCMLDARLNLTDDQLVQVDKINEEFRLVSQPVADEIKNYRGRILDELEGEEPDTALVSRLSLEISGLQLRLHQANIRHYLELKKVCTPEQAMSLSNLYRELYGCPLHQPARSMKHQRNRMH